MNGLQFFTKRSPKKNFRKNILPISPHTRHSHQAGYQITQQYNPIAKGGFLNYMVRCNTTNGAEDKKTNGEHTNGEHTNGETTNGGILNGGRMKATPQELSGGEEQRGGFESRRIHLVQIQLEQDSGKSLHDAANNRSLIDFNRAGEMGGFWGTL